MVSKFMSLSCDRKQGFLSVTAMTTTVDEAAKPRGKTTMTAVAS